MCVNGAVAVTSQRRHIDSDVILAPHTVPSSWRHCDASRSRGVLRASLDPALSVAYNAEAWQHALPTTSTHTPSPHGASLQKKKNLALAPWSQVALGRKIFIVGPDRRRFAAQPQFLIPQPQFILPAARG